MNTEVKFCRDCKYFQSSFGLCKAPQNGLDMVTGDNKSRFASERRSPLKGSEYACGQDAIWFEQKELPTPWWKFWSKQ